jgi:hypothetical protein
MCLTVFKNILFLFSVPYITKNPEVPVISYIPEESDVPFIDRYVWLRYDQDMHEKYLMLKGDGTVVLSLNGKYKLNNPEMPSCSIRKMLGKYIISLEDQEICSNGYYKPLSVCTISRFNQNLFQLNQSRFGINIVQRSLDSSTVSPRSSESFDGQDMCLTLGTQLWDGDNELDEYGIVMLPCDGSIEQLFSLALTDEVNWQKP